MKLEDLGPKSVFRALFFVSILTIWAIYFQIVEFGPLETWDDGLFVLHRPELIDWWGSSWIDRLLTPSVGYPIPVPTFIQAHVRLLFGDAYIVALRVLSIGLHTACGLAAYILVKGLSDGRTASITASLWLVHPIVVESVAWLTNLKTQLATLFALLALAAYREIIDRQDDVVPLWISLILLTVLALGCRPDAAMIPLGMLVVGMLTRRDKPLPRTAIAVPAVLLVACGAFVVWTKTMHDSIVDRSIYAESGLGPRIIRIAQSLEFSTLHFIWPFELHPAYFRTGQPSWWESLPGLAIALGLGLAGIILWHSAERRTFGLFALAGVFYLPFSNLLPLPRLTADTYLYLCSIFLIGLLVSVLRSVSTSRTLVAVVAGIFVVSVASSANQISRWQDPEELWAPVAAEYPLADRPFRHLVWWNLENDEIEEASSWLQAGLPAFRSQRAIPWYAVEVLARAEKPREAANLAIEALVKNHSPDPRLSKAYLDLLVTQQFPLPDAREVEGVTGEAVSDYLENPDWMAQQDVHVAFGAYFLNQSRPSLADRFIARGLQEAPDDCRLHRLRAVARDRLGKPTHPLPAGCTEVTP